VGLWVFVSLCTELQTLSAEPARSCPADMVAVHDFCVDRYEVSTQDAATQMPLSPYYPPEPRWLIYVHDQWQALRFRVGDEPARRMPLPELSPLQRSLQYEPMAASVPGRVPQAYLSYHSSKRLCERAGKRLCSAKEWETACRGEHQTRFPYGNDYRLEPCNVGRSFHPASILHGLASSGHLDPRLNLILLDGDAPVLRVGGASQSCRSTWNNDAIYDMVGNLDEWIDDPEGTFRGGFYARRVTVGCDAAIESHAPTYFDYSTGTRCCLGGSTPARPVVLDAAVNDVGTDDAPVNRKNSLEKGWKAEIGQRNATIVRVE
jgi:formylglycine-generating enzyme required for sulfatase activity